MNEAVVIDETRFRGFFEGKLGSFWERALAVFRNYGDSLSYDVTNVLLYAKQQGKVEEVLALLEKHWDEVLAYQHPDIRGRVSDALCGGNPTQIMFEHICENILALKPAP